MASEHWIHPTISRRTAIQAGAVGMLGLGMNHLDALRTASAAEHAPVRRPKAAACICIFLSGGLAQQDSFDLKPEAPDTVRGEFKPIATKTPGIHIWEHYEAPNTVVATSSPEPTNPPARIRPGPIMRQVLTNPCGGVCAYFGRSW